MAQDRLDFDAHSHARTTDPETSHAAAWSLTDASEMQQRVYAIFARHPEGLTDEELARAYAVAHPSPSRSMESQASPRKRRSDLTRHGVLVDSGERRVLSSGRQGVVWRIK